MPHHITPLRILCALQAFCDTYVRILTVPGGFITDNCGHLSHLGLSTWLTV